MINWNISRADHDLIIKIAERTFREVLDYPDTQASLMMDLNACHANGCPLDLQGLLEAASPDFLHDVFGIRRHIDRKTGKLLNCFDPRSSAANQEKAGV
jgi:hypothetical protein